MNSMRKLLLPALAAGVALAMLAQDALAGAGTFTVLDATATSRTLDFVTDGSGNFVPKNAICDGTAAAQCAAVKAASTAPVATDPALVVAISQNSPAITVQPGNTANTTPWLTTDSSDGPVSAGAAASKSSLGGIQFNSSLPAPSAGQQVAMQADSASRLYVATSTSKSNVSSTLTRAANTTTYAANEAVCNSTGSTCTPLSFTAGRFNGSGGLITNVGLVKSSTGVTAASFNIWLFDASPTVTSVNDASAYLGPKLADAANLIGMATCTQGSVSATGAWSNTGSDNVAYQCALPNNNTPLPFQPGAASQSIFALIQTTGAYVPASAETFEVNLSLVQD